MDGRLDIDRHRRTPASMPGRSSIATTTLLFEPLGAVALTGVAERGSLYRVGRPGGTLAA